MNNRGGRISFIIPVKNGSKYIESCLDHIAAEMLPGDEIIVVDNGSTDDTVRLARGRTGVRVLEHPELTIAGLRNRGARESSGEILAFIDSDCLIQPGWRQAVVEVLRDTNVQSTGAICDLPPQPTWVEKAWSSSSSRSARVVQYIPSANLVVRKETFRKVSGFDETLITDEDYDIGIRITRNGGRVVESPAVRAIHLGNSKTIGQFVRRQSWHATSIVESFRRQGWDRPMIMTVVFILAVVFGLLSLIFGVTLYRPLSYGLVIILIVPLVTTIYRIRRNGDIRYLPHLVLLYLLFYVLRSKALICGLVGREKQER